MALVDVRPQLGARALEPDDDDRVRALAYLTKSRSSVVRVRAPYKKKKKTGASAGLPTLIGRTSTCGK